MVRKSHVQSEETQIDMTPILDVTFIMLIFFITTNAFVKPSSVAVSAPPTAIALDKPEAKIVVVVTADNQVYLDQRRLELRFVSHVIEDLKSETRTPEVEIHAHQRSKAGVVIQVLDQVNMAGIANVSIAATVN